MALRPLQIEFLLACALLFVAISSVSCGNAVSSSSFDQEAFANTKYHLALCFDLRDDDFPVAGLVMQGDVVQLIAKPQATPIQPAPLPTASAMLSPSSTPSSTPVPTPLPFAKQHVVALPFSTLSVEPNRRLLSASSSYNNVTVISYIGHPQDTALTGIGLSPVFGPAGDASQQIDDRRYTIYLDRSGLERHFFYRYEQSKNTPPELQYIPVDVIEAIAVAIPENAKGKEIRNNQTSIPNYEFTNSTAKFYTNDSAKAGSTYLEVSYMVEPSDFSKLVSEIFLKLFGANIIPLIELILLGPAEINQPRTRKWIIVGGVVLQLIITVVLVSLALRVRGEFGQRTIAEIVNVVAGAIFTTAVLFVKRNPKAPTTPAAPVTS